LSKPDGSRVRVVVHKLVAWVFLGHPPTSNHEVCHKNGDKKDNRVTNLKWGTRKENAADREKHGQTYRGKRHHKAKLNPQKVAEIRWARETLGTSYVDLAKEYGVSPVTIRYAALGKTWREVR